MFGELTALRPQLTPILFPISILNPKPKVRLNLTHNHNLSEFSNLLFIPCFEDGVGIHESLSRTAEAEGRGNFSAHTYCQRDEGLPNT